MEPVDRQSEGDARFWRRRMAVHAVYRGQQCLRASCDSRARTVALHESSRSFGTNPYDLAMPQTTGWSRPSWRSAFTREEMTDLVLPRATHPGRRDSRRGASTQENV